MAHRRHPKIDDSDGQSADEDCSDIFDIAEDEYGSDTDATSIEDLHIDDADVDDEADVEDQIALFGGNIHLPEHYRQAVEDFNESAFDCEDYSPGTTSLLDAVEEQWCLYVTLWYASFKHLLTAPIPGFAARSYNMTLNNATRLSPPASYTISSTGASTKKLARMAGGSVGSRKRAP